MIRYPATLGLLGILIVLCVILVFGVARNSRCNLIFFSVVGLFGVVICWLLSGIYLASSVALGDFCMKPAEHFCDKFASVRSISHKEISFVADNHCTIDDNDQIFMQSYRNIQMTFII